MAKKVKLTRPELKRQRDRLSRFQRYLPMLKLKQQQLQVTLRQIDKQRREILERARAARETFDRYSRVLGDLAGLNVPELAEPEHVETTTSNIAGVAIPVFHEARFGEARYSLFSTPAWVDRALADLREINRLEAQAEVLQKQVDLLSAELTKIIQRVNLFEKVMIPECKEAIRRIRIRLGDEMTAGVARAKIAKEKSTARQQVPSQ
jgi:V/A-type H+-transporting ATPase subunit D